MKNLKPKKNQIKTKTMENLKGFAALEREREYEKESESERECFL